MLGELIETIFPLIKFFVVMVTLLTVICLLFPLMELLFFLAEIGFVLIAAAFFSIIPERCGSNAERSRADRQNQRQKIPELQQRKNEMNPIP